MKRRYWSMLLGVVLACSCSTRKSASPEEVLAGTWKPEGSVAVYEIAFESGEVKIAGRSEYSGKKMKITDALWDGEALRFTSYLASTDMKVVHENRLTGSDTMISSIIENKTGKPKAHTMIWKKQSEQ